MRFDNEKRRLIRSGTFWFKWNRQKLLAKCEATRIRHCNLLSFGSWAVGARAQKQNTEWKIHHDDDDGCVQLSYRIVWYRLSFLNWNLTHWQSVVDFISYFCGHKIICIVWYASGFWWCLCRHAHWFAWPAVYHVATVKKNDIPEMSLSHFKRFIFPISRLTEKENTKWSFIEIAFNSHKRIRNKQIPQNHSRTHVDSLWSKSNCLASRHT